MEIKKLEEQKKKEEGNLNALKLKQQEIEQKNLEEKREEKISDLDQVNEEGIRQQKSQLEAEIKVLQQKKEEEEKLK